MATYSLGEAKEKSTFIVKVQFRDENDSAITPDTLQWTLTDNKGNVVNNRSNVSVGSPSSTNYIVLKGDDLGITQNRGRTRVLIVEATYTSATYGADLPLKESAEFIIKDLVSVT